MSTAAQSQRQPRRRRRAQRPAPPSGPSGLIVSEPIRQTTVPRVSRARRSSKFSKNSSPPPNDFIGPFEVTFIAGTIPADGRQSPIDLCPASLPLGTVPRQLAGAFQRYFIASATATFSSACPYTVGGQLVMWWDNDPDESIRVGADMVASIAASHKSCVVFPPTASRSLHLPPKWELLLHKLVPDEHFFYTRPGPERRTWVQAQLWIRSLILPTQAVVGTLTIRATYWFSNPGLSELGPSPGMGVTMLMQDWVSLDGSAFVTLHVDEAKRRTHHSFRWLKIRVSLFTTKGKLAVQAIMSDGSAKSLTNNPCTCTWTIDLNDKWLDQAHGWWNKLAEDLGLDPQHLGPGTESRAGRDTECFMLATSSASQILAEDASVFVLGGGLDRVERVRRLEQVRQPIAVSTVAEVTKISERVPIDGGNLEPVLVGGLRFTTLHELRTALRSISPSASVLSPSSSLEVLYPGEL